MFGAVLTIIVAFFVFAIIGWPLWLIPVLIVVGLVLKAVLIVIELKEERQQNQSH